MGINKENQVEQCCEHETCTSYFSAFPEDLISLISSKTSARDVCRLSVVSPQFRSAAKSDLVWECFLPSNYPDIISRCDDTFASKKDFWFRTFHNIIYLDNYTKVFKYNSKGKIFCGLQSKSFDVTAEYPRPNSWFILNHENSSDLIVNLGHAFNMKSTLETGLLSPNTTYQVFLCYKTTEVDGYNFNEFSSSSPCTLLSMQLFKDGKEVTLSLFITDLVLNYNKTPSSSKRRDGFLQLRIGEFFNDARFDAVEMRLIETNILNFYNGPAIIFSGIGVRPM